MSKLYYKHKETGRLIDLDGLKKYKHDELCYGIGFAGDWDIREVDGVRKYQYRIQDVPLSDDFEPLMKPLFSMEECYLIINAMEDLARDNHIALRIRNKAKEEFIRHQHYLNKYGRYLDEI